MARKVTTEEREEARKILRAECPPGTTLFTVLRHVSKSGMSRDIDVYKLEGGDRQWLSRLAARAAGLTFNERAEAIRMGGCGMDMGFALVYELASALYPDGFDCIGARTDRWPGCPSSDHNNGDRNYEPHHHRSGGYALRHRWL